MNIETLYKHFQASAGASENPNLPQEGKIYFALTNRRPNTKLKVALWTIWRWFEVNAPNARQLMKRVAQPTRWGGLVAAAIDEYYDGNGYVDLAFDNGAVMAVVDNPRVHQPPKTILVDNVAETLYALARHHREQVGFQVVGITGTVGKTTTTNLVHAVLSSEKKAFMQNGRNTPPVNSINLLNAPPNTEAVVFEVATIRPGIIAGACEIIRPTHGLITTIGLAHLDTMGDLETIKRSKWELFDYLLQTSGKIFLNTNHDWLAAQAHRLKNVTTYGGRPSCDVRGEMVSADPFLKMRWFPSSQTEPLEIQTRLAGQHNVDNVLAAIAVGVDFGLRPESIKMAIENFDTVPERSEIFYSGSNTIYVETYQSNPASTLANLDSFAQYTADKKILFIGPIARTPDDHEIYDQVVEKVRGMGLAQVVFVSEKYDRFRPEKIGVHVTNRAEIRQWLADNRPENSMIMLNLDDWDYKVRSLFEEN